MRRGAFTDFDPTQMLPGEWAVMLSDDEETIDGYAVYICYAAGMVKRIVSSDELAALTNNIYADVEDFVNEAFDVETIMLAATNARAAAAEAQAAIDAIGDITEQSVPLMSSSTRGGAKLGVGLEITDGALSVDPDSIEFSTMSPSTRGIAKLGAGLAVSDDALTVDPMSDTQIDGVMAFDPDRTIMQHRKSRAASFRSRAAARALRALLARFRTLAPLQLRTTTRQAISRAARFPSPMAALARTRTRRTLCSPATARAP